MWRKGGAAGRDRASGMTGQVPQPSDWARPCCQDFEPVTNTFADGGQGRGPHTTLSALKVRICLG